MLAKFIKYLILSTIFSGAITIMPLFNADYSISFLGYATFFISFSIIPAIGAFIGNALREFTIPDSIFTTEGMSGILKAKLFWMFGPQCIGFIIGLMIASEIPTEFINAKPIKAKNKIQIESIEPISKESKYYNDDNLNNKHEKIEKKSDNEINVLGLYNSENGQMNITEENGNNYIEIQTSSPDGSWTCTYQGKLTRAGAIGYIEASDDPNEKIAIDISEESITISGNCFTCCGLNGQISGTYRKSL